MLAAQGNSVAGSLPGPLVEGDWLAANLGTVTILDVRGDTRSFITEPTYALDPASGKRFLYTVGGHVPGALLVDYAHLRGSRNIGGRQVSGMLPDKTAFEALVQQAGVRRGSAIVVMSAGEGDGDLTLATRLYWSLKYYGHDNVAVLNGGMAQWLNENRAVSIDTSQLARGDWVATAERRELLAGSDDVAQAVANHATQLIDTRALGVYLGTWEGPSYVYAKGHIPGAKVFPSELLTTGTAVARFPEIETLRALATGLGIDTKAPTITYCNSGHLASGSWFVLSELMGNKNVKLYDGSMHEWTLEKRPVKTLIME